VEHPNSNVVNPSVAKYILTLRYNPTTKTPLQKLTWKDFVAEQKASLDFIENSITKYIKEKLSNSSKKISLALSGGVDSTLILLMIKKILPESEINAISIKFGESTDETKVAEKIAEKFDVNYHFINIENYLVELPKAISIVKQPFWDLHWYYVVKKAKSLSQHLASGDGGDELFGGYTFRYSKFLSLINEKSTPIEKTKAYLQCHERDHVPAQTTLFGKKLSFSWESIYSIIEPYFDNSLSPLQQIFLADFNGKLLYNFAPLNSLINSHFQIKAITPLLSCELISYATHLPPSEKYNSFSNIGKIPLRNILKKENTYEHLGNQKLGFSVNTINLWKSYGKKLSEYYLTDSRVIQDGWINKEWIDKYIESENLDARYVNKFLGILAFEIWYRLFYTKEMREDEKLLI